MSNDRVVHGKIHEYERDANGNIERTLVYPENTTEDMILDPTNSDDAKILEIFGMDGQQNVSLRDVLLAFKSGAFNDAITAEEVSTWITNKINETLSSDTNSKETTKAATSLAVYNAKREVVNLNGENPKNLISIYAPNTSGEGVPYYDTENSVWRWGKITESDINKWNSTTDKIDGEKTQSFRFERIPDNNGLYKDMTYFDNKFFLLEDNTGDCRVYTISNDGEAVTEIDISDMINSVEEIKKFQVIKGPEGSNVQNMLYLITTKHVLRYNNGTFIPVINLYMDMGADSYEECIGVGYTSIDGEQFTPVAFTFSPGESRYAKTIRVLDISNDEAHSECSIGTSEIIYTDIVQIECREDVSWFALYGSGNGSNCVSSLRMTPSSGFNGVHNREFSTSTYPIVRIKNTNESMILSVDPTEEKLFIAKHYNGESDTNEYAFKDNVIYSRCSADTDSKSEVNSNALEILSEISGGQFYFIPEYGEKKIGGDIFGGCIMFPDGFIVTTPAAFDTNYIVSLHNDNVKCCYFMYNSEYYRLSKTDTADSYELFKIEKVSTEGEVSLGGIGESYNPSWLWAIGRAQSSDVLLSNTEDLIKFESTWPSAYSNDKMIFIGAENMFKSILSPIVTMSILGDVIDNVENNLVRKKVDEINSEIRTISSNQKTQKSQVVIGRKYDSYCDFNVDTSSTSTYGLGDALKDALKMCENDDISIIRILPGTYEMTPMQFTNYDLNIIIEGDDVNIETPSSITYNTTNFIDISTGTTMYSDKNHNTSITFNNLRFVVKDYTSLIWDGTDASLTQSLIMKFTGIDHVDFNNVTFTIGSCTPSDIPGLHTDGSSSPIFPMLGFVRIDGVFDSNATVDNILPYTKQLNVKNSYISAKNGTCCDMSVFSISRGVTVNIDDNTSCSLQSYCNLPASTLAKIPERDYGLYLVYGIGYDDDVDSGKYSNDAKIIIETTKLNLSESYINTSSALIGTISNATGMSCTSYISNILRYTIHDTSIDIRNGGSVDRTVASDYTYRAKFYNNRFVIKQCVPCYIHAHYIRDNSVSEFGVSSSDPDITGGVWLDKYAKIDNTGFGLVHTMSEEPLYYGKNTDRSSSIQRNSKFIIANNGYIGYDSTTKDGKYPIVSTVNHVNDNKYQMKIHVGTDIPTTSDMDVGDVYLKIPETTTTSST